MLKIEMFNWYCWADQTIELAAPCSFIVGRNGIGKSAIRDALEFAFIGTGRLRGCTTKGELAAVAIRDDFPSCEVIVEAAGIRIRRTMDRKGNQAAFRSDWVADGAGGEGCWSEEAPAPLKRDQGCPFGDVSDDLVRCMLEPTHFYALESPRRQEILLQATTDPNVEREKVLEALLLELTPDCEDDRRAIEDAATWIAEKGFREAEDAVVEQRRVAKRDRAQIVVGDPPEPMFEGIDLATNPLENHEKQLEKLRETHIRAVQMEAAGAGALQGKLTEAEEALALQEANKPTALIRAEAAAEEASKKFRQAMVITDSTPLPPEFEPDAEELEQQKLTLTQAGLDLESAQGQAEDAWAKVVELQDRIAQQTDSDRPTECPKGPPGMRCPVTPSVWKSTVEKTQGDPETIAAELERLQNTLNQAQEIQQEAANLTTAATEALEASQRTRKAYREASEAHEAHQGTIQRANETLDRSQAALHETREEVAASLEAAQARVTAAAEALKAAQAGKQPEGPTAEELSGRIARGSIVVRESRNYWRAVRERDLRQTSWDEKNIEINRWDAIAQELKPEGIETKLGGDARETFMALLDASTHLTGKISLDDECGLSVEIGREDHPRHPLQLSTSQRLAVGGAIQHALCQQAGFPILLTDALDTFDAHKRSGWAQLAASVTADYESAVVGLATITQEPPGIPEAPWKTIWLKPDGTVAYMGAEGSR